MSIFVYIPNERTINFECVVNFAAVNTIQIQVINRQYIPSYHIKTESHPLTSYGNHTFWDEYYIELR